VLQDMGALSVALSGGVDSMTLAFVAHRLNNRCQMFHALSPAVPEQATRRVKHYARLESWNLNLINAGEVQDPSYIANPVNRCYFCKTNLYDTVCKNTDLLVVSGTNCDDLGDYRPGLIAAEEHKVRHPYVEANIHKADIRSIAKSLGLADLQDLPASPCLSSRVMTGIAIDEKLLPVINEVEEKLWRSLQSFLPLKGVRCRIRHAEVAVEIETNETVDPTAAYAREAKEIVASTFKRHGYQTQTISVEAYRRGSAFLTEDLITSSK